MVFGSKERFAIQATLSWTRSQATWGNCGIWLNGLLVEDQVGEICLDSVFDQLRRIQVNPPEISRFIELNFESADDLHELIFGDHEDETWRNRAVFYMEGFDSFIITCIRGEAEFTFIWAFNPEYSDYEQYDGLYPDTVSKVVIPRVEFNSIVDEFSRFLQSTKPQGNHLV